MPHVLSAGRAPVHRLHPQHLPHLPGPLLVHHPRRRLPQGQDGERRQGHDLHRLVPQFRGESGFCPAAAARRPKRKEGLIHSALTQKKTVEER